MGSGGGGGLQLTRAFANRGRQIARYTHDRLLRVFGPLGHDQGIFVDFQPAWVPVWMSAVARIRWAYLAPPYRTRASTTTATCGDGPCPSNSATNCRCGQQVKMLTTASAGENLRKDHWSGLNLDMIPPLTHDVYLESHRCCLKVELDPIATDYCSSLMMSSSASSRSPR